MSESQQHSDSRLFLYLMSQFTAVYVYVCDCQEGRTALHYAAVGGHTDAVRLLITAGCDINARDQVFAVFQQNVSAVFVRTAV